MQPKRGAGLNDERKGKDHCGINLFTTKNSLLIKLTDFYIVLNMLVPSLVLDNPVYIIDVFSVLITHLEPKRYWKLRATPSEETSNPE